MFNLIQLPSGFSKRLQPLVRVLRQYGPRLLLVFVIVFSSLEILQVRYTHQTLGLEFSRPSPPSEKIFIASLHWNNEKILDRSWNKAVIDLATILGPQNVFVSAYESGSWDNTTLALERLEKQLDKAGIRRKFVYDPTTHKDELRKSPKGPGWIDTPRGQRELRRIPYLARLRNLALEPLKELHRNGEKFDKILFLNDVVFQSNDALRLLMTNNGDYAAACALDFNRPPEYYDTFALRDSEGHETVMQTWPYFRARGSRYAIKNNLPVPVKSCWNGMMAMDAQPFLSASPIQFRGLDDSLAAYHLEGSECCLIHADNPLSDKGVYLNPHVRVAYSEMAYEELHPKPHENQLTVWRIFVGLWKNRVLRWFTTPMFKEWAVRNKILAWKQQGDEYRAETGDFCVINEMQVLVAGGWKHV
ncbi:hypothetical protein BJ508DRAFT_102054 [Ascobolus immersus RN42]|uniref:Polysaccharide export protein n=1 Tax=Ascobolus immersus RN42 TaxID=1160509 RepID=A0A3N4I8V7_ASCIM|nr:hypothetical protein BJ508DRAFT_102054 [Ascobolus immersus RN42]